ncbi:MAG: ATP-dependent zinc metalloprotease FtsH [Alphaproteobacteria bacterium]|nr:ATP-dependent zinc metalloprotease FtsH [Alphaproteobacteria bacterium]
MKPEAKFNAWYLIITILGVMLVQYLVVESRTVEPITYSEFQDYLREGRIADVVITRTYVQGSFKQPLADGRTRFVATRVEPELAAELATHGVKYSGARENTIIADILSWVAPIVAFFVIWMLVFPKIAERSGMGGGFMAIGKSKAKVYVETDTKATFADVAGVDEAKEELKEIVAFLKDPGRYGRLGARIPRGILLVGPPGTGKTLLARAVAGEANVPFFSISGSEFVEMFVGVGAARVRDLFEQARQRAPAIIFIDELDALGRARGIYGGMGGHDEKEQTLNQLLSELDGFDPSKGVVLLAATNRPEILDPALLRAGRFDRQVLVDRPDKTGRIQILAVHLKKVKLAADVAPADIAALTPGFTGADLANLVNEAALLATRRGQEAVAMADFTSAVERIVAGLEKRNRLLNPEERRVVAYHEMGHALVALSIRGSDPIHKVSIIPRGIGALGYTIQRPTEDRFLMSRDELEAKMIVLLGGRSAEELVFGRISTGAADDLAKVTDIARAMVARYGMDATLGPVTYERETRGFLAGAAPIEMSPRDYSEETAREIDRAVRGLVVQAAAKAKTILESHRDQLERGAGLLLQRETLLEADLAALVGRSDRPA